MIKSTLLISMLFCLAANANTLKCPYPESAVAPEVTVQATSKGDGGYEYQYTLSNGPSAKVPLRTFWVETSVERVSVVAPKKWKNLEAPTAKKYVNWSTSSPKDMISPNAKTEGFTLIAKGKPGVVRAFVRGSNPGFSSKVVYSDVTRTETTSCPGFWEQGSSVEGDGKIAILTVGPVPNEQVSPNVVFRLPNESKWLGSQYVSGAESLAISPLSKGDIEIAIFQDAETDLSAIDKKSLKFGRGEAKPKATRIAEIKDIQGKMSKALVASFSLEDVNPLCGIDRALFLEGKLANGKTLFSGVKIQDTPCTEATWSKELPKIMNRRDPNQK